YRRGFRNFRCRLEVMRRRRQERHLEPGLLVVPARSSGKSHGDQKKRKERILWNHHPLPQFRKVYVNKATSPGQLPGTELKSLQQTGYTKQPPYNRGIPVYATCVSI